MTSEISEMDTPASLITSSTGFGALEQVAGQFLELCAGQLLIQVDGALGGHGQVLQGRCWC